MMSPFSSWKSRGDTKMMSPWLHQTFVLILPQMWHKRFTPSAHCTSQRPLPNIRVICLFLASIVQLQFLLLVLGAGMCWPWLAWRCFLRACSSACCATDQKSVRGARMSASQAMRSLSQITSTMGIQPTPKLTHHL
jgi:hypothetical protein